MKTNASPDNDFLLLVQTIATVLYNRDPVQRLAALRSLDQYEPEAVLLAARQVRQPA